MIESTLTEIDTLGLSLALQSEEIEAEYKVWYDKNNTKYATDSDVGGRVPLRDGDRDPTNKKTTSSPKSTEKAVTDYLDKAGYEKVVGDMTGKMSKFMDVGIDTNTVEKLLGGMLAKGFKSAIAASEKALREGDLSGPFMKQLPSESTPAKRGMWTQKPLPKKEKTPLTMKGVVNLVGDAAIVATAATLFVGEKILESSSAEAKLVRGTSYDREGNSTEQYTMGHRDIKDFKDAGDELNRRWEMISKIVGEKVVTPFMEEQLPAYMKAFDEEAQKLQKDLPEMGRQFNELLSQLDEQMQQASENARAESEKLATEMGLKIEKQKKQWADARKEQAEENQMVKMDRVDPLGDIPQNFKIPKNLYDRKTALEKVMDYVKSVEKGKATWESLAALPASLLEKEAEAAVVSFK